MARHCQASHGYQAIRGWPGPSADGLGPRLAPNREDALWEMLCRRWLDRCRAGGKGWRPFFLSPPMLPSSGWRLPGFVLASFCFRSGPGSSGPCFRSGPGSLARARALGLGLELPARALGLGLELLVLAPPRLGLGASARRGDASSQLHWPPPHRVLFSSR